MSLKQKLLESFYDKDREGPSDIISLVSKLTASLFIHLAISC